MLTLSYLTTTYRHQFATNSHPPHPCINGLVSTTINQFSRSRPITFCPGASYRRRGGGVTAESPAKQCKLDPIPTWLVKHAGHVLAPVIAAVCNASFQQLTFSCHCKNAIVPPLLKKCTMDFNDRRRTDPSPTSAFYHLMLCMRSISHGPVSACHKSEFY